MHSQGSGSPPSGGRDGRGGRGRGRGSQPTSPTGSRGAASPTGGRGAASPTGRGQSLQGPPPSFGRGQVFGSIGGIVGGAPGSSWQNPIPSFAIQNNPGEQFRYLVDHMGQWLQVNAAEGRQYEALGFSVYNMGSTWPLNRASFTNPLPAPNTSSAFEGQTQQVYDAEDRLRDAPDEDRYGKKETPKKGKNGSNQSTPSRRGPGSPDNGPGSGDRGRRGPPGGGAGGVAA